MSFGEWDDKVCGRRRAASRIQVNVCLSGTRTKSQEGVWYGFSEKKQPAPAGVQPTLPSSFQAPRIAGGAGGHLLQSLACETRRRAGSTPTAVDAHAFELECHSNPGSSPSRAPGPRAIDARRGAVLSLERVRRREASRRGASRLQKLIWSSCGSSAAHGACVLRLLAA